MDADAWLEEHLRACWGVNGDQARLGCSHQYQVSWQGNPEALIEMSEVNVFSCTILGSCQLSLGRRLMVLALALMLILRIASRKLAVPNLVLGFGDSGTGDAT